MKKAPFTLRSSNKPSIAKLSGVSPVKEVKGTKDQDRKANEDAQMSYTDEATAEARAQLTSDGKAVRSGKFNLSVDPDGKNKKGQEQYSDLQERRNKNVEILRASRHQQKFLKATGKTTI